MESTSLTTTNPQLWRLTVHLDGRSLYASAQSTVSDEDVLCVSATINSDSVEALEETVYGIPGMVDDFSRVDVVVRTGSYGLLPDDLATTSAGDAAAIMGIDSDDSAILRRTAVEVCGAAFFWTLPAELGNFLARTFRNPGLHLSTAVLAKYFCTRGMGGNCAKTYVHFQGSTGVDIISFDAAGGLRQAFSKTAATDSDTLYYIMAALKSTDFDAHSDRLLLCGDRRRREVLSPLLRKYVANVLPVIFPSGAYGHGHDGAPFALTVLSLCE